MHSPSFVSDFVDMLPLHKIQYIKHFVQNAIKQLFDVGISVRS